MEDESSDKILEFEIYTSKMLFEVLQKVRKEQTARALILTIADENEFTKDNKCNEKIIIEKIKSFSIPIILIIKDSAKNFVFDIVLASHLCIAADTAKFEIENPENLSLQVGSINLEKLNSNIKMLNAEKALDLGFINKAVPRENFKQEAFELAERISNLAPLAIKSCLQAVSQGLEMNLENGLKLETELFTKIFATKDMKEGTNAFLEKRKPNFRGR